MFDVVPKSEQDERKDGVEQWRRLLSGAGWGDQQPTGRLFLRVALVVLINQVESTLNWRSLGERRSQSREGTADFLIILQGWGRPPINSRSDKLIIVGYSPENLAVRGFFYVLVTEAGNLLVAIEHQAQTITPDCLLQKCVYPAGAP